MKFKISAPEEKGIADAQIQAFEDDLAAAGLPMHSILVYADDALIHEHYFEGYSADRLHNMYSVTKNLTAIAIGLLIEEGKLSLDDKICDYFPDMVPEDVHPYIAELTIRQCLMMKTCHRRTTYKLAPTGWVKSFFTTDPTHRPGTEFNYDTSSAHNLCALVERLTGMDMMDYLRMKLAPIGLSSKARIEKDPEGVSIGGAGLLATSRDILALGVLLLNQGVHEGQQLIPRQFAIDMCSPLTDLAVSGVAPFRECGYGYMTWTTAHDGFAMYGHAGQFVLAFPKERLILVTTAYLKGIDGATQKLFDAFEKSFL